RTAPCRHDRGKPAGLFAVVLGYTRQSLARGSQAGRRRKRLVAAVARCAVQPRGIIRMKNNVARLHRDKDPAAYRPQPARGGSDFWPTIDRGLILALVYEVLPALPVGVIWEAAAGAGHLVDPL